MQREPSIEAMWAAFDYEIEMYFETQEPAADTPPSTAKNAFVESMLLHTRILTDFLLDRGSQPDDVQLRTLVPNAEESEVLREARDKLRVAYGTNKQPNSTCWTLNKRLAHLTNVRSDRFDWGAKLNAVHPHIWVMLTEIGRMTRRPVLLHYLGIADT